MVKRRQTHRVGSGITERTETRITTSDSESLGEALEEVFTAVGDDYFIEIQAWAVETLEAAGLPTVHTIQYPKEHTARWEPHRDTQRRRDHGYATVANYVVAVRGYKPDTPEGYAARILDRLYRPAMDPDNAIRIGYELGYIVREATMKFRWERHALSGEKSNRGASEGGKARSRGTSKERRDAYNKARNAGASHKAAIIEAAQQCGVSERTIYRSLDE